MDFSFLKNFGQMIGHGAKAGFGAVKSGIGKLGEMGSDDNDEGYDDGGSGGFNLPNLMKQHQQRQQRQQPMPMTPGFNPNASMPSLKAPMMGGDSGVRKIGRAGTGGEAFGIDNSSRGGSSGLGTPDEGGGVMIGRRISVDDAMPDAFDMPFKASQVPSPLSRMGNSTTLPAMDMNAPFINRSQPMQNQMPQLQRPDAPSPEPIRDSVDIRAQSPGGQVGVTDQQPQMIPLRAPGGVPLQPPMMTPQSFGQEGIPMVGRAPEGQMDRRQDVPIPQLPGHRGEPIPYNEMDAAKWDHVYGKMQHGADGHETGVKRSWKTALANGVLAMNKSFNDAGGFRNPNAWQAGLAGGATGAIGTAIAPQAGQEVNFDWAHRPEIEDRQRRQQEDEDRGIMKRGKMADIEGVKARTAATIAGTKDAELVRRQQEAGIAKTEAQTEALKRGTMIQRDVKDADGVIRTYNFFPGKEPQLVGESAKAAMNTQNNEARGKMNTDRIEGGMARTIQQGKDAYRRTQAQQGGANWRTTQTQAGQNKRTADKINAQYGDTYTPPRTPMGPDIPPQGKAPAVGSVPTKRATAQHVQEYAQKFGVSPEEARKRFEAKGYRVE
jgi:hypothetical protein